MPLRGGRESSGKVCHEKIYSRRKSSQHLDCKLNTNPSKNQAGKRYSIRITLVLLEGWRSAITGKTITTFIIFINTRDLSVFTYIIHLI